MIEQLLTNRTIEGFQIAENAHCWIVMNGGYVIGCGSLLRYVGSDGAFFTNEDHGHKFGLPAPYDSQAEIESRIKTKVIESVELTRSTGDLTLRLGDARIEILCTSLGYENWQLDGPEGFLLIDRSQRQHG